MLQSIHAISLLVILLHPGKYMLKGIHAISLLVIWLHPGNMLQLVVVDEGQCYCHIWQMIVDERQCYCYIWQVIIDEGQCYCYIWQVITDERQYYCYIWQVIIDEGQCYCYIWQVIIDEGQCYCYIWQVIIDEGQCLLLHMTSDCWGRTVILLHVTGDCWWRPVSLSVVLHVTSNCWWRPVLQLHGTVLPLKRTGNDCWRTVKVISSTSIWLSHSAWSMADRHCRHYVSVFGAILYRHLFGMCWVLNFNMRTLKRKKKTYIVSKVCFDGWGQCWFSVHEKHTCLSLEGGNQRETAWQ